MFHLCLICHEYPPFGVGGIGSFTRTLAEGLVNRSCAVTVIGSNDSAVNDELNGVRIRLYERSAIPKLAFFANRSRLRSTIRDVHREHPIDLLEAPNSGLSLVGRRYQFPKIMRFHGGHQFFARTTSAQVSPVRAFLERMSIKNADFLCAVSRFNADTNRRIHRLGSRDLQVIYNPVNTSFFAPEPNTPIVNGRILFLGNFSTKKGVFQLLDAAIPFLKNRAEYHLMMVGRDWVDPFSMKSNRDELERLIPPDLRSRIQIRPQVPHEEVPGLIARAETCIAPSLMEAHPVLWLEIMSMGKPLIASVLGPGPEVITHMQTGLLCNPMKKDEMTACMRLLADDPQLRLKLGAAARNDVVDRFDIDTVLKNNIEFYAECIDRWRMAKERSSQN